MMKGNLTRFGLRGLLTLALTLGLLVGFKPGLRVNAAIFQVNTTSDTIDVNLGDGVCADSGGQCSLRAAVMQANALAGQDTIHAPAGLYLLTRGGTGEDAAINGDLDIKSDLILTGAGQNLTIIDGNQLDRVFEVFLGVHTEISDVTIQGGKTNTPNGVGFPGGGIFNNGILNLTRDKLTNNTTGAGIGADGNGGNGGGIYNVGTLSLVETIVFNNTTGMGGSSNDYFASSGAGGGGGGVFTTGNMTMDSTSAVTQNATGNGGAATGDNSIAGAGGAGGGIYNMGALTINGSLVNHNSTGAGGARTGGENGNGGAGGSGGGVQNLGTLVINGGLIEENTTGDGGLASAVGSISGKGGCGGGIYSNAPLTLAASLVRGNHTSNQGAGGGLCLESSTSTLVNDAILDNQAGTSGSGLFVLAATPHLLQTTLSGNSGGDGSGVYLTSNPGGPFSTLTITNTIMVDHSVGINVTTGNTVTAKGLLWYNTPTTVALATGATANLSIQVVGDPAFTADGYHLTVGSAAINRGIRSGVSTDIDGAARPYGCAFDLGADEYPGGPICRYVYISFLRRGK
jgi:CSLREA domain-containing protein